MLSANNINRVLVIGIGGGLAQILTNLLLKTYPSIEITGVDNRSSPESILSPQVHIHRIKYTRNSFERLFRNYQFDCVFHLGRLSHANKNANLAEITDVNVMGTQRILDLSLQFHVKKVVILSTYHVYGAYSDNPIYLPETSPLRATFDYPELHDVVEMDQGSSAFLWRYKDQIETIILRPCNIIGSKLNNAMSSFLTMNWAPLPMDFNPMFQFIHESDMARVLLQSLENLPSGIYNVAPDDTISMTRAKKLLGVDYIRLPISLVQPLAHLVKIPVPAYLFEYLKYSCILGTDEIKKYLGEKFCRYSTEDAVIDLTGLPKRDHG